jgi:hypothetical protein
VNISLSIYRRFAVGQTPQTEWSSKLILKRLEELLRYMLPKRRDEGLIIDKLICIPCFCISIVRFPGQRLANVIRGCREVCGNVGGDWCRSKSTKTSLINHPLTWSCTFVALVGTTGYECPHCRRNGNGVPFFTYFCAELKSLKANYKVNAGQNKETKHSHVNKNQNKDIFYHFDNNVTCLYLRDQQ